MLVRLNYGPDAGREKEFPFHVGRALVAAGRAERVDPVDPSVSGSPAVPALAVATPTVVAATPPHEQRDPAIAPSKVQRSVQRLVKRLGRRR